MEDLEIRYSYLLFALSATGVLAVLSLCPVLIFVAGGAGLGIEAGQIHIFGRSLDPEFLLGAVSYAIVELFFIYEFWRAFFGKVASKYFWAAAFVFHLILSLPALTIVALSSIRVFRESLAINGVGFYVALYSVWLIFAVIASAFLFLRVSRNKLP